MTGGALRRRELTGDYSSDLCELCLRRLDGQGGERAADELTPVAQADSLDAVERIMATEDRLGTRLDDQQFAKALDEELVEAAPPKALLCVNCIGDFRDELACTSEQRGP